MTDTNRNNLKYGVRIYKLDENKLLVKQTIKIGERPTDEYVIDGHKERHVSINDNSEIAAAVRDGIAGKLQAGSK